jgi:transposase-like protein/IS1 family transposase
MSSKEKKTPLTPETTFCPNFDCPARGQVGAGNIGVHSQKDCRYICRKCNKSFSATTGTLFYRLRKGADLITLVVKLLSHGCPIQAIVFAFGLDERTVRNWFEKSGQHSKLVHEHLVEQPRPVGQVQCDELRIKLQGAIIWMGMAIMVQNRLWLGGEISASRDSELIENLITRVRRCASALGGAILFCVDGLPSYPKAIWKVFREKEPRDEPGRCRMVEWRNILIAQVIKQYENNRVIGVKREIYQGTPEAVAEVIKQTQGKGDINTAFIERINGTFRSCLHSLARRTRSLARQSKTLQSGMYLVGCVYNFCTEHKSLRLPGLTGGHKWLERTPAMASGITDHCWTVDELLSYKVPPPRWEPKRSLRHPWWEPKKPRGRPRKAPKSEIGGGANDHG